MIKADYNRKIAKQIAELTTENELLKSENKVLKAENRELRQKLKRFEDSIEEKIARAVERACAPLHERIRILDLLGIYK
jgi:regulator of replication initiation timing